LSAVSVIIARAYLSTYLRVRPALSMHFSKQKWFAKLFFSILGFVGSRVYSKNWLGML
jgi:hypothetical protein